MQLHNGILASHKETAQYCATIQINLENIMLKEKHQRPHSEYHVHKSGWNRRGQRGRQQLRGDLRLGKVEEVAVTLGQPMHLLCTGTQ